MGRAIICLLLAGFLSACGGAANTAVNGGTNAGSANTASNQQGNDAPDADDGGTKPDPELWRKVKIPTPEGWVKASQGHDELTSAKYGIFLKPSGDYPRMAFFSDVAPPHASSGSDAQWKTWRETTSACFVYSAGPTGHEAQEALKRHGRWFIQGFDDSKVILKDGIALYVHPADDQKWLACVRNANGAYILVALVRGKAASDKMKPYPASIQPE